MAQRTASSPLSRTRKHTHMYAWHNTPIEENDNNEENDGKDKGPPEEEKDKDGEEESAEDQPAADSLGSYVGIVEDQDPPRLSEPSIA